MRVILLAAFIFAGSCSSEPPPPLPSPAERAATSAEQRKEVPEDMADGAFESPLSLYDAEQILLRTETFDAASPAYRPGRQVEAFNVVIEQNDARQRLRRLARQARAPGRLYALCGLLLLEREEGLNLAHSLSLEPGNVTVRDGDFIFETPTVRAIVLIFAEGLPERIRAGRDASYSYFKRPA